MTILVLAEAQDAPALWLAGRLRAREGPAVEVVTPLQLVCSPRLVHRLSTEAGGFEFRLVDGRVLGTADVEAVVNRLVTVPTQHLQRATPVDRTYAAGELHAFLLGWLGALTCPVLNPPAPDFLVGPWRPPLEVAHLAAQAGLPFVPPPTDATPIQAPASGGSSFVLDGQVLGAARPAPLRDGLLRFASLWGARLVQVDFDLGPSGLALRSATSFVDFRAGGDLLVRGIRRALSP